ncbi:methyltransferase family protein [Micromonospora sp. Llam0]|uniref:class I SAM-dependent methyltransferase n=1 Tax=Micromonospora sp. Llam0 TaxID=2485143 RepID=UPI000F48D8A7|nr:class I SAM-dependent methyltransferase [Micromonospora sp. Llam0]ROO60626.1 methyltransferase family protein [Micromonospora sp. Llam0]
MDVDMAMTSTIDGVEGWFSPLDQVLFTWLLRRQGDEPPGDLVELGVYLGKSAILMGRHLRPGDRFTVCDLFEIPAQDDGNREECEGTYPGLLRSAFEKNYLRFHETLPLIVQGHTRTVLEHVRGGTCRFAHVDASHLYEHVSQDVDSVQAMLRPTGVAVFDDFRAEHTPGTAAAVWEAVLRKGLRPICFTRNKFYGTWGDPEPARASLIEWLAGQTGIHWDRHRIAEHRLIRLWVTHRQNTSHW